MPSQHALDETAHRTHRSSPSTKQASDPPGGSRGKMNSPGKQNQQTNGTRSRPCSSIREHGINSHSFPTSDASKLVVSPRPLKLADYEIVGPIIRVPSSGPANLEIEKESPGCGSVASGLSSQIKISDFPQLRGTPGGEAKRSRAKNQTRSKTPVNGRAEENSTTDLTPLSQSQTTPHSGITTPSASQRSAMLEALRTASIRRNTGGGSFSKQPLASATEDDDSSPESPRQRLNRRSQSPNSPRRSPLALRGKHPPKLLPGVDLSGSMALYFGGPIKEFGRRASSVRRTEEEEADRFLATVQHAESDDKRLSGDNFKRRARVAAHVDTFSQTGSNSGSLRDFGRTDSNSASVHSIPSVHIPSEDISPLYSPERFGGRYSPRDGRRVVDMLNVDPETNSGAAFADAFERTLSAARAASLSTSGPASFQEDGGHDTRTASAGHTFSDQPSSQERVAASEANAGLYGEDKAGEMGMTIEQHQPSALRDGAFDDFEHVGQRFLGKGADIS